MIFTYKIDHFAHLWYITCTQEMLVCVQYVYLNVRKIEGVHWYKLHCPQRERYKKVASYIYTVREVREVG